MLRLKDVSTFEWFEWLATGFGVGVSKYGPGTLGSLLACLIYYLSSWSSVGDIIVWASFILVTAACYPVISKTEDKWGQHDSGHIVIDEVSGLLLVYCFFSYSPSNLVLGFVFFRIFDIFKFGLVKWADQKLRGAWGTLIDDLVAGIMAVICMFLAIYVVTL